MTFAVFALLPLALLSWRRNWTRSDAGFLPLLAMLAPVIAKGVGSLIKHKQQKGEEKKASAYAQQQAAADEAAARSKFEAAQDTPQAAVQRLGFNMKLGKLLGAAGGREKLPPSILSGYDTARQRASYVPGAAYTPPPTSGGGLWGFLGGAADALSYLDTSKLKRGGVGGAPTTPPIAQTGQLNRLLKPQNPADSPLAVTSLKRTPFYG